MSKFKRDWAPVILGTILTIGVFVILGFVLTQPIPEASIRVVDMIIGSILTQWVMAMGYFFGTTASSSKKTDLIAQAGPVKEQP